MTKKKILYLITKSNMGGAQIYVYNLATSLPKTKFDISIACGNTGKDGEEFGWLYESCQKVGIRTIKVDSFQRDVSILKEPKLFIELCQLVKKERPDIIHLNSSKAAAVGALVSRIFRIENIIFTIHGLAFNEDRSLVSKLAIKLITWLTIFLSTKTILINRKDGNQIKNWPFIQNKLEVIYNGINKIELFDKSTLQNMVREKNPNLNIDENTVWFGTIAELHKNKGLPYLIEATSEIKDENFTVVIIGKGEEKENLEKLINKYELRNKITLFGELSSAAKYLKALDVFLLVSIKEGLPLSILEAGQAKLPIIASGVGGIPEIIDDMSSGIIVRPKNSTEIKEAMRFLLNKPEKRKGFGEKLNNKITKQFDFKNMVKQTRQLYNRNNDN
jgi:glycosyltransferase involved in cell wall biosynthesis